MDAPPESPFGVAGAAGRPGMRRIVVTTVVAVACLVLAFRGVDGERMLGLLGRASPAWIAASLALAVVSMAVRCVKLGLLLRPVERIPYRVLLGAELISVLVDTLIPVRANYLVRAWVIGRRSGVRPAFVLGAEVVEKVVEILLLAAGMVALASLVRLPDWAGPPIRLLAVAACGGIVALALLVRWPGLGRAPAAFLARRGPALLRRVGDLLGRTVDGVSQTAARPGALVALLAITAVEWALLASAFAAASRAVGVAIGPLSSAGFLAANHLAFAIPASTSGAIGVYEVTVSTALTLLFGLPKEEALSAVLVAHTVLIAAALLGGAAGFRLAGPARTTAAATAAAPPTPPA